VSTTWERLANEPILDIQPYQPGKPIEELERELGITGPVKLASSENPFAPPPAVREALQQALAGLHRYPDGSGYSLRQALAKKHGVSPDGIVLGNGSNELIELLARTFVRLGEEVVIPHPSFVVYKLGVIVRPMTSFGLERALRVTVGTPEENARLLDALRVVLGKDGGRS
jgi:histidinol-phosphate aminotransferase